jgi:hypothetical protein
MTMARPKKITTLREQLRVVPNARAWGSFIERLPHDKQTEFNEIVADIASGAIVASKVEVARRIKDAWKLAASVSSIRAVIAERLKQHAKTQG